MTATTPSRQDSTETKVSYPGRPILNSGVAPLFINGKWVSALAGGSRAVHDPSTGAEIGYVGEGTSADVSAAVQAARIAFDTGPWPRMSARERGRVLLRAAQIMRERSDELARLESLDTGKPMMFSGPLDVTTATEIIEYYGSLAATIEGSVRSTSAAVFGYTLKRPIGVVAAITPFNFPLILSATKIGPALAAGNTLVHKPAEDTPLTARLIAEICAEAGLPDGVLNVVTGGAEPGEALVRDPRVDKVAFTGSTAVGRRITEAAAASLKHVTVELGGKGANIVFADADFETAVKSAINGFVFNTGQFCMAGSRLLVERSVYHEVVDAIAGALPHIPVGDPFDDTTVIGPMAGARHRDKVMSYINSAKAAGQQVITGATSSSESGYFVTPTVVANVDQRSPLVQEEIFGPVMTVQAFDTESEAIALADDTIYGLAAGLQTSDVTRAHRVADQLQAGLVWVNTWGLLDAAVPFGGVKQSGYGRECGPEALAEYQHTKSVLIANS